MFAGKTAADKSSLPPPAMNEIDFEGTGQWGKLVRSTRGGRLEQYELDFGGGHKDLYLRHLARRRRPRARAPSRERKSTGHSFPSAEG
jgi:hypothetical protein